MALDSTNIGTGVTGASWAVPFMTAVLAQVRDRVLARAR